MDRRMDGMMDEGWKGKSVERTATDGLFSGLDFSYTAILTGTPVSSALRDTFRPEHVEKNIIFPKITEIDRFSRF